jgi:hypothetical protein
VKRLLRAFVGIGTALLVCLPASAAVTPERVIGLRGEQYDPFAKGTLVAFSTYRANRHHTYLRDTSDGSTVRVEASGQADANGFDPADGRVLYTNWNAKRRGNLFLYDPVTGDRSPLSDLNTREWEWDGRISSTFVLFLRARKANGTWHTDVMLFDRAGSTVDRIATYQRASVLDLEAGSVGDRYATWTVCRRGWACSALLYDPTTGTVRTVPTSHGRRQYAPVVDEANDVVYFTRLGGDRWCHNANIWRLPLAHLGTAPTKIVALPGGTDTGWTSSLLTDGVTGSVDLYFERYVCSNGGGDIFRAAEVDAVA